MDSDQRSAQLLLDFELNFYIFIQKILDNIAFRQIP